MKGCSGSQVLQEEEPSGTSWETPVDATGPDKVGGTLGAPDCNKTEGNSGTQEN